MVVQGGPSEKQRALRIQNLRIDRRDGAAGLTVKHHHATPRQAPQTLLKVSFPTESYTTFTPRSAVNRFTSTSKSVREYRTVSSAPTEPAIPAFPSVEPVA